MDHYYRDLAAIDPTRRHLFNFDVPQSIDLPLLLDNLRGLKAGSQVEKPRYLFPEHVRAPAGELVEPHACVIVEGLFALYWEEIRRLLSVCVFVETPDEVCLQRRVKRDVEERGQQRRIDPQSIHRNGASDVSPIRGAYPRLRAGAGTGYGAPGALCTLDLPNNRLVLSISHFPSTTTTDRPLDHQSRRTSLPAFWLR